MTEQISIHPSRVGWDIMDDVRSVVHQLFQSTHPVWDGTQAYEGFEGVIGISIHPSRVGWDFNKSAGR